MVDKVGEDGSKGAADSSAGKSNWNDDNGKGGGDAPF